MAAPSQNIREILAKCLPRGIPLDPMPPAETALDASVPHAPKRYANLTREETRLALRNALRYFPEATHATLAGEFAAELATYGHIYMRRFRPREYEIRAYGIDEYPARSRQAAAIMLMVMNNLDVRVAQFPHELVTYGGNGSVLGNWAQYHLLMRYLSEMDEQQTLSMYSGHPMGLYPSHRDAPRVVITNGMVVWNYSDKAQYEKMYATGVSLYGQMTAGSYCYIGPQGIVHGTTITVLNAGRKYLGTSDLRGKVYVTSGLGGMSGAQAKAAVICGAIGVIAEINEAALDKRKAQGWVQEKVTSLDACVERIRSARAARQPLSIAYLGNVVDLWERLADEPELLCELGSDQTSLHNPYGGGYYPVQLSLADANHMMVAEPQRFRELVHESLRRQVAAINRLTAKGMRFWDYGNSFLLEAARAGADVLAASSSSSSTSTSTDAAAAAASADASSFTFRYPSYVQDIMGDIFSLGFGPFRWVCTSGDAADLALTDRLAADVIERLRADAPAVIRAQFDDNHLWITQAEQHQLVVGSQARILYSDARGRIALAEAFNDAIAAGRLRAPVVLSRDHHDVSGVDSPWRETSNISDGSMFTADMAVQNFCGDAMRGATWVALHNGGGTGWGEAVNGGFGLVLDGSPDAARRARSMLHWDVNNGVSRRAWAGNQNAHLALQRAMEDEPRLRVTVAHAAADGVIDAALA